MRVRFPRIAFLFACAVSLALPLAAQSPNGTINGLVLDPSNKVIAGADILVINDATGVKYAGKTNDEGIYVVPNLPPGPYRLQVSKVGFKTLIKPDIVLNIQDALSINFTLPVGAVFETVTVEGGASMINTTDASVSTVVDQAYVKNMPLNGRSFQDLILLTPGIVTQTPQNTDSALGQTGEFSVNGQRPEANYYTIDGVSANVGAPIGTNMNYFSGTTGSLAAATALGTTQALVSVDDLQEFRVQSSSYSAEYGRTPGGQIAFETKSGTNQWHGTAYDYLRNGAVDANDWFNDYLGLTEPNLRQNDFGGTLGAPVKIPGLYDGKDKTFFFVSYEGLRLVAPRAANVTYVPDASLRSSAPVALQPLLDAFPIPNGRDFGDGFAEFIGNWTTPGSIDSTSVRFDHLVNDKLKLSFRFSDTASSSTMRGAASNALAPSVKTVVAYTMRTYTVGATSSFTVNLSNDFRVNYSSNYATSRDVIDAFGGATPVDLVHLSGLGTGSSSSAGVAPLISYDGYNSFLLQEPSSGAQRQWNLVDTVSLSSRHHHFKFGLDFRRLTPFAIGTTPLVEPYFASESSVVTNTPLTFAEAQDPAYPLYMNFSAFAQDKWRVSQRLNLSVGVRWEVNPAPGVTQGLKPYALQGTSLDTYALAPYGTPLWQTTWYNFAPRLGAVYLLRLTPGCETVVRGGGGVFYDTAQQLGSIGFGGPGYVAQNVLSAPFPVPVTSLPTIVNPPVKPYEFVNAFDRHLQLPYTLQWNASIEQALGASQALTVSYVGAHGSRLLKSSNIQTPNNPNASSFGLVQNGLTSDYDAMQIQFRRNLSRGLTAMGSYTWSHCIDYGSQNYNLPFERGNCDFDVRSKLSGALSYDLPNAGRGEVASAVLHHWGVDGRLTARTAFPVTLLGNGLFDPTTGQLYYAGLDLVHGQPIYLYGANCDSVLRGLGDLLPGQGCPGSRAINPQAFTIPSSTIGNAPRNFVRGFGAWQTDLAVRRDFPIFENVKLQFRAEAFNIFNHPNFGLINANFGQATFGQATSSLANSLGILSPLYQMGGPRSMQFALKLMF